MPRWPGLACGKAAGVCGRRSSTRRSPARFPRPRGPGSQSGDPPGATADASGRRVHNGSSRWLSASLQIIVPSTRTAHDTRLTHQCVWIDGSHQLPELLLRIGKIDRARVQPGGCGGLLQVEHHPDLPGPQRAAGPVLLVGVVGVHAGDGDKRQAIANLPGDLVGDVRHFLSDATAVVLDLDQPYAGMAWLDRHDVDGLRAVADALELVAVEAPLVQLRYLPPGREVEREISLRYRRHQAASTSR